MAIPQPNQARTAQRALVEYTIGEPDKKADLSTAASSPTISSIATNPIQAVVIGLDSQTQATTIGAFVAGNQISIDLTIPMKNFPTNLQFGISDRVYFDAQVAIDTAVLGVALASFKVTPQAFGGLRVYTGPLLPNAVNFSSYNVRVQASFVAVTTTSSGIVNVNVNSQLFDIPG